jgi:NAD(P)-dependent dehydrogenase (short-subunit alcohol dehydrogenase family)
VEGEQAARGGVVASGSLVPTSGPPVGVYARLHTLEEFRQLPRVLGPEVCQRWQARPRADGTVYAATKHALTAVAEGLRMEVHTKGIRVIKVEPGLVRTEFPESSYPSAQHYYAQREYSPLEAEDVAEAVLYAVEQPHALASTRSYSVRPSSENS